MAGTKLQILVETTRRLIRRQATANLKRIMGKTHPADIAHLFEYLNEREQRVLFDLIEDSEKAAEVLSEIDEALIAQLLEGMDKQRITEILQAMSSDDRADFISELPEELAEEILSLMAKKQSEQVEDLLSYQEDTAGRIMTHDFFALADETSAREAIEALQKASEAEMVFYVYVIDDRGHLVGVISLRQLITVPPTMKLKDIMVTDVISVRTDMDQEEVAKVAEKYNILAVPVVDEENKLVGIITVDDIIDVIREEATEDIMKMAGTREDEFVYRDNVLKVSRFRLPWILTNLLGGLITGYLLWLFKITIRDVLALITFIPVITAMGGNDHGYNVRHCRWTGRLSLARECNGRIGSWCRDARRHDHCFNHGNIGSSLLQEDEDRSGHCFRALRNHGERYHGHPRLFRSRYALP